MELDFVTACKLEDKCIVGELLLVENMHGTEWSSAWPAVSTLNSRTLQTSAATMPKPSLLSMLGVQRCVSPLEFPLLLESFSE